MKLTDLSSLKDKRLLVAISGGIDSVVLAHALHAEGIEIVLAHCNFHLRGEESDGDEAFVRQFATELGVPLLVKQFDTKAYAQTHKLNTQLAARELRYHWFEAMRKAHHCDKIATAHHTNDNLETFIINLSRGSGLEGLLGIPEESPTIVRPLLHCSREEIHAYSLNNHLSWREDSSNATDKYTRNKIRHNITPLLEELHPNFLGNFNKTQVYLHQTVHFIDTQIAALKEHCFKPLEGSITEIDIATLKALPELDFVLHKFFYPYGFNNIKDLKQLLLGAETGKQLHSRTHRLLKNRNHLLLEAQKQLSDVEILIEEGVTHITTPIELHIEHTTEARLSPTPSPDTIFIDADKLTYPLTLRHRREGDFFYPEGMHGKKKLSKYFKDEKYSQFEKEQQWLLCSGEAIVWVVGKRLDGRVSITSATEHILKIHKA